MTTPLTEAREEKLADPGDKCENCDHGRLFHGYDGCALSNCWCRGFVGPAPTEAVEPTSEVGCPHMANGWCAACVKAHLTRQNTALDSERAKVAVVKNALVDVAVSVDLMIATVALLTEQVAKATGALHSIGDPSDDLNIREIRTYARVVAAEVDAALSRARQA